MVDGPAWFLAAPRLQLRYNLAFARSAGFDRIYLWGAEWWFYAREKLGVPDFVKIVKELWEPAP